MMTINEVFMLGRENMKKKIKRQIRLCDTICLNPNNCLAGCPKEKPIKKRK